MPNQEENEDKAIAESIVDIKSALNVFQSLSSHEKKVAVLTELAKQDNPFSFIENPDDLSNFVYTISYEAQLIFYKNISNEKLLQLAFQREISSVLNLPPARYNEFVDFLDVHKIASISPGWEMLIFNIEQLPQEKQYVLDVNDLSIEELTKLNINWLNEAAKSLSHAKMTELIDSMSDEVLVSKTMSYMSIPNFEAVIKYSSDKKLNSFIDTLGSEKFLTILSTFANYKYITTDLGLTPERKELFADKLFANLRATIKLEDTAHFDSIIHQVGEHISPAAREAHADLIVRNLAPDEMIKHVFEFKQKLVDQKEYIQGKVKPAKEGAAPTAEQISTKQKSEVIDKMIARIERFILKPEINEYKKFVEAVKTEYMPQMAAAPKHGLFGRATGKPSGSMKVFTTFSQEADDILIRTDAGYDKPRSPSR